MGVLTDFIVAPREDAKAVVNEGSSSPKWPSLQSKGLLLHEVAAVHALLDGEDPNRPTGPPARRRNPFTGKEMDFTRTVMNDYMARFDEFTADDGSNIGAWVFPDAFTAGLAKLEGASLE